MCQNIMSNVILILVMIRRGESRGLGGSRQRVRKLFTEFHVNSLFIWDSNDFSIF